MLGKHSRGVRGDFDGKSNSGMVSSGTKWRQPGVSGNVNLGKFF